MLTVDEDEAESVVRVTEMQTVPMSSDHEDTRSYWSLQIELPNIWAQAIVQGA